MHVERIIVVDTTVFVATVRSVKGSNRDILRLCLKRHCEPLLGTSLFFEFEEKHERLRQMAKQRKNSINKLMEEMSTATQAQFDAEVRFRALARQESVEEGLKILTKLDNAFSSCSKNQTNKS